MTSVRQLRPHHSAESDPLSRLQRFRSVPLKLGGRFLDSCSEEHALLTREVSCGGATIVSKARPGVDSQIVCYIDDFARIAGRVVHQTSDGFVMAFDAPENKREKLADRLVWLLNAERLGLSEERAETRIPITAPCQVTRSDGSRINCRVVDISLSGASFETTDSLPKLEEIVRAGTLAGTVVRRDRKFFAIHFITPTDPERERLKALREKVNERIQSI